jgi:hypothetical protein
MSTPRDTREPNFFHIPEVSRPTVYRAREVATDVLKTHFEAPPEEDGVVYVRVDRAQLERAVVGARMEAPCSIRDIER